LVSEIDRHYLFSNSKDKLKRVSVFSNGVALDVMHYQFDPKGLDIIFIGNMFSLQNFDAAMYMSTEILPLIRRIFPEVRLRLIGRIRAEHAAQLFVIDGVDVIGEVADVSEAARGGSVGVCPLRLGAGVQNKVLEYMALGLPVVSTTIGVEGFQARDGIELIVADDPEIFANQVIRLLRDRTVASALAENARYYVENNHSWSSILSPMLNIIQSKLSLEKNGFV